MSRSDENFVFLVGMELQFYSVHNDLSTTDTTVGVVDKNEQAIITIMTRAMATAANKNNNNNNNIDDRLLDYFETGKGENEVQEKNCDPHI